MYKVRVESFHNNKLQRKKRVPKGTFTEQINAYLLHAKILTLTLFLIQKLSKARRQQRIAF